MNFPTLSRASVYGGSHRLPRQLTLDTARMLYAALSRNSQVQVICCPLQARPFAACEDAHKHRLKQAV